MADDPEAFPTLDDADLAVFEALGTRRSIAVGDYLYREGDASYDFYVVVSGTVDILVRSDGEERLITRHGRGRFLGELNLLTGMRAFVSARVVDDGEVIAVPRTSPAGHNC
jgi:thioredoxin reductase (NADPH)